MSLDLSIIVPTFRRPQILRRCLDAIALQTIKNFEVIVISDGPDDGTAEMMTELNWPFELQYFAIQKSHQGICRNRGLEKARGEYVLLIGDDIFLAPNVCERHVHAHEKNSEIYELGIAVLGHTTWDSSLKITPLMQWMEKSGLQFGYPKIEQYRHAFIPKEIQHFFTYTSHISLPREVFYKHQFREDVSLYGWEDVEWGLRLADAGIGLYYEPNAKAFHHHTYSDSEVWARSELLGESAVRMERLVPNIKIVPHGWKKLAYWILSFVPNRRGKHCGAFLRGMKKI